MVDLGTGTVTGFVVDIRGIPANGQVTFTPTFTGVAIRPDLAAVVLPSPVYGRLVDGQLQAADGSAGVVLTSTDGGNPPWQWRVQLRAPRLSDDSPAYFSLPAGQTVDLVSILPVTAPSTQARYTAGPSGPAGPAGPQGPAGVQSVGVSTLAAGSNATAVLSGTTLNLGIPRGATGATGATGLAGPQGPAGADSTVPGPAGPKGDTGATGPAGPQGPKGADSTVPGPAGPKGDTGPAGPAGADSTVPGPAGPAGPAGAKGDTGATGPAGPAGVADDASVATLIGQTSSQTRNALATRESREGVLVPDAVDHATVQAALTSAVTSGVTVTVAGSYTTDQTLTIYGSSCDLSGLTINYTGTGVAVDVGDPAKANFRGRFKLPYVINKKKTALGWAQVTASIGVRIVNHYGSRFEVPYVRGFEVGLSINGAASNGSQQNSIFLGHVDNNMINLDFNNVDQTGWSNQNTIFGGRCSHDSNEGTQVPGTRHVRFAQAANPTNGNLLLGTSLESPGPVEYHVESNSSVGNIMVGCRWENTKGDSYRRVLSTGSNSRHNMIIGGMYGDKVTTDCQNGGWPFMASSPSASRYMTQDAAPLQWLEHMVGATSNAMIVTAPGVMADATKTPSANYSMAVTANSLKGKRTADTGDRVTLDFQNGKILLNNSATGTAFGLQAYGQVGLLDASCTLGSATNGSANLGQKSNYRFGNVFATGCITPGAAATASRPSPTVAGVGGMFFDTTLNKPIWVNAAGTGWVDATGTAV